MEINDILQQLDEVLEFSVQIKAKVESEQWDTLVEDEKRRREMVSACFSEPVPAELSTQVAEKIKKIIEIDNQIRSLCKDLQSGITRQINGMRVNKEAMDAYKKASR